MESSSALNSNNIVMSSSALKISRFMVELRFSTMFQNSSMFYWVHSFDFGAPRVVTVTVCIIVYCGSDRGGEFTTPATYVYPRRDGNLLFLRVQT
jgi:hypothetical protein